MIRFYSPSHTNHGLCYRRCKRKILRPNLVKLQNWGLLSRITDREPPQILQGTSIRLLLQWSIDFWSNIYSKRPSMNSNAPDERLKYLGLNSSRGIWNQIYCSLKAKSGETRTCTDQDGWYFTTWGLWHKFLIYIFISQIRKSDSTIPSPETLDCYKSGSSWNPRPTAVTILVFFWSAYKVFLHSVNPSPST